MKFQIIIAGICYLYIGFVQSGDIVCPDIPKPEFGDIFCTGGFEIGSICTIMCNKYYDLSGTTEREVKTACDEFGAWSEGYDATCEAIRCFPVWEAPVNGDLICSADNLERSLCVFYCDEHFKMVETTDKTAYSTCEDDGDGDAIGVWTNSMNSPLPPTCQIRQCEEPREDPVNGHVSCTAESYAGSFCVYYCDDGYDMVGTSELVSHTICEASNGGAAWSNPTTPICKERVSGSCQDPPDVKDGVYYCTSDTMTTGTRCTLQCTLSSQVAVDDTLECTSEQKWESLSESMPSCITCNAVKFVQLFALIHSEDTDGHNELVYKLVNRFNTFLLRKDFKVQLRVQRFGIDVQSQQYSASSYLNKQDKNKMEDLPFPLTDGENMTKALEYAKKAFESMEDGSLQVLMVVTNEGTYSEEAAKVADEMRENDVAIFAGGLAENGVPPEFSVADLEKITGDPERVYVITHPKHVEHRRYKWVAEVTKAAIAKGCGKSM